MAAPKVSDLSIGNYLKIVSKGAVYNNLAEDAQIWDMIKKKKKGDADGRQLKFLLRSAYGAAAVGSMAANGGAFRDSQKSSLSEGTAEYKDFGCTIEVENSLVAKAISDFGRYGEPLAEEMRVKTIALSRELSRMAYRDGTGVLGTISGTPTISGGKLVVVLSSADTAQGSIAWFEQGDRVILSAASDQSSATGGQRDIDGSEGATSYMEVSSIDRENDTVTLTAKTSADVTVTLVANDNAAAGDLIRRYGNILDASVGTADYNSASYDFLGLEAFAQNDGRKVHGIDLSGSLGATRHDAGGDGIDSQDFQKLLSKLMIAVGGGRYTYNKALMAWETYDSLVESREVDRRFQSVEDGKRGVKELAYVHGKNTVMFAPDEFCPKKRIFVCPEGDVLQFYGSDFSLVEPNPGQKFHLKPNASGHDRVTRAYMEGQGCIVNVHGAAIGAIHNFE